MKYCEDCSMCAVGAYKIVDGRRVCGLCRAFHENLITLRMYDYILQEVKKPCRFCGRIDVKKNFDHVNMFEKEGTVGIMVMQGCPESGLLKEIQKCQILCVDCHRVVTSYEMRRGFMKKKSALRRAHGTAEARAIMAVEYERVMTGFYRWMEEKGGEMVLTRYGGLDINLDI